MPARNRVEHQWSGILRGLKGIALYLDRERPPDERSIRRAIREEGLPAYYCQGIGYLTTIDKLTEWVRSKIEAQK